MRVLNAQLSLPTHSNVCRARCRHSDNLFLLVILLKRAAVAYTKTRHLSACSDKKSRELDLSAQVFDSRFSNSSTLKC
jgi:hypothetical protein